VSDSFTKADGHRMEQIPSKDYADYIRTNFTDVSDVFIFENAADPPRTG
jgi:hypothetical protein